MEQPRSAARQSAPCNRPFWRGRKAKRSIEPIGRARPSTAFISAGTSALTSGSSTACQNLHAQHGSSTKSSSGRTDKRRARLGGRHIVDAQKSPITVRRATASAGKSVSERTRSLPRPWRKRVEYICVEHRIDGLEHGTFDLSRRKSNLNRRRGRARLTFIISRSMALRRSCWLASR